MSPWTPSWHRESSPHCLLHFRTPTRAHASLYCPFSKFFPITKSPPQSFQTHFPFLRCVCGHICAASLTFTDVDGEGGVPIPGQRTQGLCTQGPCSRRGGVSLTEGVGGLRASRFHKSLCLHTKMMFKSSKANWEAYGMCYNKLKI